MNVGNQPPSSVSDHGPHDVRDVAFARAALQELVELGMEMARMVRDEAKGPAEAGGGTVTAADASVAFDRVARAVRRTLRMLRWLDEPVPVRPAVAPGSERSVQRAAARARIIRTVEDRIDESADKNQAGDLHAELIERMDGPELDDDIATRPVGEIIASILSDLGLQRWPGRRPSPRRTPADIVALHARAHAAAGKTRDVVAPELALGRVMERLRPVERGRDRAVPDQPPPDSGRRGGSDPPEMTGEMTTEAMLRMLARAPSIGEGL